MMREVESVASLHAEEVIVNAALVAIVAAHDFAAGIGTAHAEGGLATIAAVRADGADVLHLPRAGLVAIGAGSKRADRANVDAHAALFALEMVFLIGSDDGTDAAILNAQSPDVHALAADAHAAITKDAAWPVEVNHRRPLLLFFMILGLDIFRFGGAVGERHVLQFALAACVADRAIERMVAEQQLDHGFASLADLVAVGGDDHAFADDGSAGGLELGHLLDFDDAHAACALQREARVITE